MKSLETYLIRHCSPTLASLKTANLFCCSYRTEGELQENMDYWNEKMSDKGIRMFVLRKSSGRALIYVCRIYNLEKELRQPQMEEFLRNYGYEYSNVTDAIKHLQARLKESDGFPHEIGAFLGYPLEDVIGFIDNAGKKFVCSGVWKVYGNKDEAEKTFCKYKKCTDVYIRLWNEGKSIGRLTVAA